MIIQSIKKNIPMENNNIFAKVNRGLFLKLRQDAMLTKSEDIIQRATDVEKYSVIAEELEAFGAKATAYKAALINANDGGRILIATKDLAKTELKEAFKNLANALDFYAKGKVSFILDLGLGCQQRRRVSSTPKNEIAMPYNVVIKPTDIEGWVEVSFDLLNRTKILNVGVEWRIVGETTWNNGTYFSGLRGNVKNLPSLTRVEIRLRSIGRGDLKSEWTRTIVVPVL